LAPSAAIASLTILDASEEGLIKLNVQRMLETKFFLQLKIICKPASGCWQVA
jgi:hypothetical protein